MKMASDVLNNAPWTKDKGQRTPLQIMAGTDVSVNAKHYNTFACPVYVSHTNMQQGKPHGKWSERARVGVYLGQSPDHNKNVALVLDRDSGYGSPQFHIKFDNQFDSVTEDKYDSEWKVKTGLIERNVNEQKRRDRMPTVIPGININVDKNSIKLNDNIQEGEVERRIRHSEGAEEPLE